MIRFNDIISTPPRVPNTTSGIIKGRFKIQKSDEDKMLAFGWANVAISATGEQLQDYHDDLIDPEELEQAAYAFVELYREGGEMHERGGVAVLVESMVLQRRSRKLSEFPKVPCRKAGGSDSKSPTQMSGKSQIGRVLYVQHRGRSCQGENPRMKNRIRISQAVPKGAACFIK